MNSSFDTFFENKYKIYSALFLATLALYLNSVFYDFSPFDDQWMVVKNMESLKDWSNLKSVFSNALSGLYYRPMLNISFMLDAHLGGELPFIFHLGNIIMQAISVILLYQILILFAVNSRIAFLFSLLFAVHPLMLHAVAWIPGRNDLLLTVFALASVIFLIKFLQQNKIVFLILNFLFFILALLTKENAFLLVIIYIQIYFIYNSFNKKIIILGLAWFFIALCCFILLNNIITHYPVSGNDSLTSYKNFVFGFLFFIGKTLIPWNQSVFPTLNSALVLTGLLVSCIFIFFHFKFGLQNKKIAYTGLSMFFILLAVPVWYGATSSTGEHYEHRIHTALIGLIIYVSQLKFNYESKFFYPIIFALIAIFAAKTFYRMDVYKSKVSFLDSGINEGSKHYHFYFEKANILFSEGQLNESIDFYSQALALQPTRPQLLFNRGNAYAELHKKDEAIADYSAAYKYSEKDPFILVTRCITFNRFNDVENGMRDLEELQKCCPKDIPKQLETELVMKWNLGFYDRLNKEIDADPNNAILYVNRAKYFMDTRKPTEALADLKKACELEPNNAEFKRYYNELANSFPRK